MSNNSDEKCSQPWEDDRDRVVWLIDLVNESVVILRKSLVTEGKEIVQYNAVGEQLLLWIFSLSSVNQTDNDFSVSPSWGFYDVDKMDVVSVCCSSDWDCDNDRPSLDERVSRGELQNAEPLIVSSFVTGRLTSTCREVDG